MEVHPLRSCLSVRMSSKVETVLGSVFVSAICLLCPISSSNSMIMLHPLMPQASSSLLTNISTPTRWSNSHGNKTSVHDSKWRCFASRSVFVNISATCWIASSLKVGRWKMSSSSMVADGSWWGFVLFGGLSVAEVQLDPEIEMKEEKNKFRVKLWRRFQLSRLTVPCNHPFAPSQNLIAHNYTNAAFPLFPHAEAAPSAGFSVISTEQNVSSNRVRVCWWPATADGAQWKSEEWLIFHRSGWFWKSRDEKDFLILLRSFKLLL